MVVSMNFKFQNLRSKVANFISPKKLPTIAQGTSGTEIFSGMFNEESLQKLLNDQGIEAFDQMRRGDAQVKMLLSVSKGPIKSATWLIQPVDDSEEEIEIAAFIEHILFNDIGLPDGSKRKTFSEFITEALTFIEFGHSVFEVTHKLVENHPRFGTYHGLADLGFRHQRSILEWNLNTNGSIKNIRQCVPSGDLAVDVHIDGKNIIVFTIEKEGDNYQGISMLRPCYGNWFRKNVYRQLQAIGIERAAKGVPIGKIPADILTRDDYEEQRKQFQKVLDALASHQTNGIIMGAGFELEELKLTHDADKVQKVIKSENIEMTKAFLANFMEMGIEQGSGSYALGSDISDIFLSGLTAHAKIIEERIDLQIIQKLVNAKFGPREFYPKLKATGINDKAGKEIAEIIQIYIQTGVLKTSDRLEAHVSALHKLPPPDRENEEDESEEDSGNPESESESDDDIQPENKGSSHKKDKKKLTDACDCGKCFDKAYAEISADLIALHGGNSLSKFEIDQLDEKIYAAAAQDVKLQGVLPSVFIARNAQKFEAFLQEAQRERSNQMITKMINIIKKDPKARAAALDVTMPGSNKFKAAIRSYVGEVGQAALDKVLKELDKTRSDTKLTEEEFRDLPNKSKKFLTAQTALFADFLDVDMEKVVLFSFNSFVDETDSAAALSQEMTRQRDRYLAGPALRAASVNLTSKTVNTIRNDAFQEPEILEDVESFVFTNPAPVSAICQNLTGRVFSKEEFATTSLLPPLHHNCMDSSTEVYTDKGWKLFADIDINEDIFLSLNPENFDLEYVKAHRYIARPFKGELYHFTNNQGSVSQCVTPDHPMVYLKRVDRGASGKIKEWRESDIPTFIGHGSEAYIYCSSEWKGISKDTIEVNGKKYPIEPFLKMMGYYLSEGHCDKNFISISQFHKENLAIIKKDMEWFGFNVRKSGIAFKDESLYEWLAQFGKSYQKYVPEIIKELSPDHLRIFLDAFCLGDGCTYTDRPCFTGKSTYRMFATSSHRMAGDITEILIKCGRSASMRIVTKKGTETKHRNGTYKSNHDVWGVFDLSSKTRRVTKIEKIGYDDIVYDVSLVKNHTLLIKHNGCISWGSNCKSFIVAQTEGKRGNKPIDPNELQIVGSPEEVEKARKSITI